MKSLSKVISAIPAQAVFINNVMNATYKSNPTLEFCIKRSNQAKALLSIRHGGKVEKLCATYFLGNPEPTYYLPVCFVASMTMSIAKARRIGWVKSMTQDLVIDCAFGLANRKSLGKPLDMKALSAAFESQKGA